MRILLLADYFMPFNPGGSEWSVFYLAQDLQKHEIKPLVVTPNYGAASSELVEDVRVIRFPFYRKTAEKRSVISPIWQSNPFYFFWSVVWLLVYVKKFKADVLHVNGKYLIPGAVMTSKLTGVPVIVTSRDKIMLCSYGKCFFEKNRYKACSWIEYLTVEFKWYYQNYVTNKNFIAFIFNLTAAVWNRIMFKIIALFMGQAKQLVAISQSQKKYLVANGFKNVKVIYNSFYFNEKKSLKTQNYILYAGKLSLGKGVLELIKALPLVNELKVNLVFAGSVDNRNEIEKLVKKLAIRNVKFLGGVKHFDLIKLYSRAKLVVMPSIYPEAFGRVALESLAWGRPVIVSNRGGLPEIVEDFKTGRVVDAEAFAIADAIKEVLVNLDRYENNILRSRARMKQMFEVKPIEEYIRLYKRLIKEHDER